MGVAIPQVITPSKASGAQVIDGSLKFDKTKSQHLKRTPGSAGNRKTHTLSCWVKRTKNTDGSVYFMILAAGSAQTNRSYVSFKDNDTLQSASIVSGLVRDAIETSAVLREAGIGWYHLVVSIDTTQSTAADRVKIYVNGELQSESGTNPSQNDDSFINSTNAHYIGETTQGAAYFDGHMSQFYFIDGQALTADSFGFTDPLTNTWKPKKYEGTFGTNGFYLPMDGNSPIGEDKSGNGNDWTPVNFGGSNSLEKATGALPILNTTQGGTRAGVGVFGSKENKFYTVTTANGSVYQFDITSGDNPSLEFIRGATYKFDYSSHTGHPLLFSSTNPDSSTTAYTDGTSIASNVISFTVPHDAPSTLYYYCSAHPTGMNGAISVTTDETKADPYAWKNVLALPLVGTANDESNQINNGSTTKSVTVTGPVASSALSNFYGGSFFFDGSNDELNIADSADWDIGSGDFTIEFWMYQLSITNTDAMILNQWGASGLSGVWYIKADSLTTISANFRNDANLNNGSATTVSITAPIIDNKWHHIVVSRSGTNLRIFVDGILQNTATMNFTVANATEPLRVGRQGYTSYRNGQPYKGYIQDVRFYKGVAKYTENFVVGSTTPDVLPDTPSGMSGGSKLTKITDGAVGFDGATDFLSLSSSTDFAMGTGDFTAECFIYATSFSNAEGAYSARVFDSNTGQLGIYLTSDGSGTIGAFVSGSDHRGNNSPTLSGWTHVALTRSGSTVKIFLDGVLDSSFTNSGSVASSGNFLMGARSDGTGGFLGYISNFRIIKGTALYTSDFTPPTRALTNVTNTKLLCCQSNLTSGAAAVSPNISGVNDGTVWSSLVTGPTRKEDRVANAFNGSTSSPGAIAAYPGKLTFAPGLTGLTSVRIYGYYAGSGVTLHVNGAAQSPSSGASFDITISTSTLDSIVWTAVNGSNYMRLDAVVVDGTTLIDPVVGPDDSNETATTFNPFNTDINTVRGQETGYATLNPLNVDIVNNATLSNGNLRLTAPTFGHYIDARSTIAASSIDCYCELTPLELSGAAFSRFGVGDDRSRSMAGVGSYLVYFHTGAVTRYPGNTTVATVDSYTAGDVIGMTVNSTQAAFYKNGILQGTYSHGLTGDFFVTAGAYHNGNVSVLEYNFGQKPFKFPPPDGFQPLNNANVRPETVITRPDQYVGATIYTGNGSTQSINVGHKPDFVWIKTRTGSNRSHYLFDSVRGVQKFLQTDATTGESSATANSLTSFNNNGFTTGSRSGMNDNTVNHVTWTWKAGGNKNTFNIDDVGYANASDVNMSVGSLNSSVFNKSDKWSDDVAGSTYLGAGMPKSLLFDGVIYNNVIAQSGTSLTFTPSGLSSISSLRIYGSSYTQNANGIVINGIDYTSSFPQGGNSAAAWVTIPETSLTSIVWSTESNGLENGSLLAIEVDGKLLVDNDQTPNAPTIASTGASVGTKQGFSIVKFTGTGERASFSHGLSQAPDFMICKRDSSGPDWGIYHRSVGKNKVLYFSTSAAVTSTTAWNNNHPTDSLVFLGANGTTNGTDSMIYYIWHNVPGLQKFGNYIANGAANGNFIELGFRPAILWIKATGSYSPGNWFCHDAARDTFNPTAGSLQLDSANVEDTLGSAYYVDFLSNGFKLRANGNGENGASGNTYMYAAWAEAPTVDLFGGGANAR